MLVLIDLSVRFIVAGCLLYFQNEKGAFPCSGAAIQRRQQDGIDACRQRRPDGDKSCCCCGPLAAAAGPQAGLQSRFGNENWDEKVLMVVFGVAGCVNYRETVKGAVTCGGGAAESDDDEVCATPPQSDAEGNDDE